MGGDGKPIYQGRISFDNRVQLKCDGFPRRQIQICRVIVTAPKQSRALAPASVLQFADQPGIQTPRILPPRWKRRGQSTRMSFS
jgi:hypothetical protein